MSEGFFIGWDVGGWNCDRNALSRDAVAILDASLGVVGTPWRGNLRETLNRAGSGREWVCTLFHLCGAPEPPEDAFFTLGIDTPLGFSEPFLRLAMGLDVAGAIGESGTNPYLFRQTELHLFRRGLKPLSAIKDMIGSQATKGMHALALFVTRPEALEAPGPEVPEREGWIWVPRDALGNSGDHARLVGKEALPV